MDHVRVIQEIVDAHKEEMPTGVVTDVMAECQKAYNDYDAPKLYKLTWTTVNSHTHVEHVDDLGVQHGPLHHQHVHHPADPAPAIR